MSKEMFADIKAMHDKYQVHEWVKANPEKLGELMKFRFGMLTEEFTEAHEALADKDADELVDALIDLVVIALGTLDIFGVDAELAWDRVDAANMSKEVGTKATRPNSLGLPDLIKPAGWTAPCHKDNLGTVEEVLKLVE